MRNVLKFLSLFLLPTTAFLTTILYFESQSPDVLVVKKTGENILSIPYQNTLYEDFGIIHTPIITLPVKTTGGFKKINFLVDTGAIVSAMPAKETKDLGISLAFLPRIAVEGYGGQTTLTYRGSFVAKILDDLVTLPCVFSELDNTNYILGRKGLVENYTITFNAEKKAVEFIKKSSRGI